MQVYDAAHLPAVDQPARPGRRGPRGFGHVVSKVYGEKVARVEVAVSVVSLSVKSVIEDLCADRNVVIASVARWAARVYIAPATAEVDRVAS